MRNLVSFHTLKTICEGWFNSILVYCLPLYGGCDQSELNDLQVLQNEVARLLTFFDPRTHRTDLFDKLQWLTVSQLIFYHTVLTIFQTRMNQEPEYHYSILSNENRNGRVIIPTSNITLYRKSFIYRGIISWNTLPQHLRNSQSLRTFKKDVKIWILQNVQQF